MAQVIFKYPLEPDTFQKLMLPKGAQTLSVDAQGSQICLWALINLEEELEEERFFEVYGTGHEMSTGMGIDRKFIGTVILHSAKFVVHVFEYLGV